MIEIVWSVVLGIGAIFIVALIVEHIWKEHSLKGTSINKFKFAVITLLSLPAAYLAFSFSLFGDLNVDKSTDLTQLNQYLKDNSIPTKLVNEESQRSRNIQGPILIVTKSTNVVDQAFFSLPDAIAAKKPSDVKTLVVVEYSGPLVIGKYDVSYQGKQVYNVKHEWDVTVIDALENRLIASKKYWAGNPSNIKNSDIEDGGKKSKGKMYTVKMFDGKPVLSLTQPEISFHSALRKDLLRLSGYTEFNMLFFSF